MTAITTIALTPEEKRLQSLLLDVAKHIDPDRPPELRFAGGWVRDKLLGYNSHDIDIAISGMTGESFGLKVKSYLEQPGTLEKYGMSNEIVRGLHKIAANPEKSKQLETATTKVFGLDLDLVNLRKEIYNDESRNPIMEFGTAEEDAIRRDATINSMFYNLQTSQIEDLTGQGLTDMRNQTIRTPLAPYQTFKDDPLRILRLIRFASRLGFTIETAAIEAMKEPSIKEALKAKISRERVGIEVEKMLKGHNPRNALRHIDEYGLYCTVFIDPTRVIDFEPNTKSWHLTLDCLHEIMTTSKPARVHFRQCLLLESDDSFMAWTLSALVPWVGAPEVPIKKTSVPMAVLVAREGIKAPNKTCDVISSSIKNLASIVALKNQLVKRPQDESTRGRLGLAIRNWGSSWRSQVIFALMVEHSQCLREDIVDEYEKFMQILSNLTLLDAFRVKPLIDGKILSKELGLEPGPWMKDALDLIVEWQLDNPDEATPEKAIEAIRHGELAHILAKHYLELTIRPLFSKEAHSQLTRAGHMKVASNKQASKELAWNEDPKPWKECLQLLAWCISVLQPRHVPELWPNVVPPVLKLIDDEELSHKVFGLRLLCKLLSCVDSTHLEYTGTAPLFEATIRTTLSYLPSLTPEDESIEILNVGFEAWLTLTRKRWPQGSLEPVTTTKLGSPRSKRLSHIRDQIVRGYIGPSIAHIDFNFPRLHRLLLSQLQQVILFDPAIVFEEKKILSIIASCLMEPLLVKTYPELVLQATRITKIYITHLWPMLWSRRADLLGPLLVGWIHICCEIKEEDQQIYFAIKREIVDCCTTMLAAIAALSKTDDTISMKILKEELSDLVKSEPLTRELFKHFL